jgi:uncharacterized protein
LNIGIIKFSIRLPGNKSLKEKRRVVHSLCQKIRNRFGVSIAEVEQNDNLKMAVIGISFVSNSSIVINRIISQLLSFLQENTGNFILLEFNQEIISR